MRITLRLAAAGAALVLGAAPASAQLLGSNPGGTLCGVGESLGGTAGGTIRGSGAASAAAPAGPLAPTAELASDSTRGTPRPGGRAGSSQEMGLGLDAGSVPAGAAGALSVQPGMIGRDPAGRAIGEVRQVRAAADGLAETVVVTVGDRVASVPAENFTVAGDTLVSAIG